MNYDQKIIERGKSYYRNNLVKYCIKYKNFLFGEVIGSEIYKVKVDLDRVGIAINFTNPDGTPHYAINTSVKLSIIPKNKKNCQVFCTVLRFILSLPPIV